MNVKLKPCPWCGQQHDMTLMSLSGVRVTCDQCGAEGPVSKSDVEAKRSWNMRWCEIDQLQCLYEIRQLIGDPTGRLMQSEVVERVREMADHFRVATKKGKGGKR